MYGVERWYAHCVCVTVCIFIHFSGGKRKQRVTGVNGGPLNLFPIQPDHFLPRRSCYFKIGLNVIPTAVCLYCDV